jgi:hypothetical protein
LIVDDGAVHRRAAHAIEPADTAKNKTGICEADHICLQPLVVIRRCKPLCISSQTEVLMKRLFISGFVVVALLAVATTLRSHSPRDDRSATTALASAKKSAADVNKLPVEEFEDMSLVFSTPTKH